MIAPFGFSAPVIRFGRGVAHEAVPAAIAYNGPVIVVHGKRPGPAAWLVEALTTAGRAPICLPCPREPDLPMIESARRELSGANAAVIIGLGGGAVIDFGKALAALIPAPRPAMDHLEIVGKGLPLDAAPLPFIAIPTTAGTGAEVTKNAVIGVPDHGRKVSLRDARMLADLALVDPALTDGCPKSVTLASGLDAITQVIEPYLCTRATPMTDALCRAALPRGLSGLARLMEGEDPAARDDLAFCALSGGLALANSGLGAVHGLAGPIGGMAPAAAHGAVCGALLPHVFIANTSALPARRRFREVEAMICSALELPDINALATWTHARGLPTLSDMGLTRRDHRAVAEAALESSSMKANPAPLDHERLCAILAAASAAP